MPSLTNVFQATRTLRKIRDERESTEGFMRVVQKRRPDDEKLIELVEALYREIIREQDALLGRVADEQQDGD